jgi:hypothetical protein
LDCSWNPSWNPFRVRPGRRVLSVRWGCGVSAGKHLGHSRGALVMRRSGVRLPEAAPPPCPPSGGRGGFAHSRLPLAAVPPSYPFGSAPASDPPTAPTAAVSRPAGCRPHRILSACQGHAGPGKPTRRQKMWSGAELVHAGCGDASTERQGHVEGERQLGRAPLCRPQQYVGHRRHEAERHHVQRSLLEGQVREDAKPITAALGRISSRSRLVASSRRGNLHSMATTASVYRITPR